MMKKSLLALTAVAFVAMMAFAQDIKTAVSKSQSGAQTSGYVKKDVKKKKLQDKKFKKIKKEKLKKD